jgi:hypothetical protein
MSNKQDNKEYNMHLKDLPIFALFPVTVLDDNLQHGYLRACCAPNRVGWDNIDESKRGINGFEAWNERHPRQGYYD